ncbi:alpha-L-fucosidase [Carboxylicivirga marina]|uniref:alpha-L-fucosidase n=1 Tax=Carboxylicivirga marina TaxID=2800988 RepID=UPI00259748F6|nr:alpha-L-fucosidase [uncultured Carboxylicivirga sp.]
MKRLLTYVAALLMLSLFSCDGKNGKRSNTEIRKQYNTKHESIASYDVPAWYSEGKLGIFMHLSAFSVPAYKNEWYPTLMYYADNNPNVIHPDWAKTFRDHHEATYGSLKEFGYKDFIPMFKLENFNANYYAELVKKAGASYFAAPAVHHDGFAMWDSEVINWNAVKMGPKRDVVGELTTAMRKQGIKTGVSTHYGRHWKYYTFRPEFDTWNPEYKGLYGKRRRDTDPPNPEDAFKWESVMNELVDNYQPDYIFVDGGICDAYTEYKKPYFRDAMYRVVANYYNKSVTWDKRVVLSWKRDAMQKGQAVYDTEKNEADGISKRPWQAHFTANGSWAYTGEKGAYPIESVLRCFIDLVSRNGNLLLNIAPRPDGTLDKAQENLLLELGQWMEVNGEGIKESTPWEIHGTGELNSLRGGSNVNEYDTDAVRYTQKDGVLYAWFVSWPSAKNLTLPHAGNFNPESIIPLGGNERLKFVKDGENLIVELPENQFGNYVWGVKLTKD